MVKDHSLRVYFAGASQAPEWQGGEPVFGDLLVRGLRELGAEVIREGSRRSFAEFVELTLTPYDAEPSRVLRYGRRLREVRPDIVLSSYDYDCSLILAARKEGIPVIACVQIYWPTCPIGTRYIEGVGVCDTPGLTKCLRHISRAEMSPNLGLPVPSLAPPLGLALYAKLRMRHDALGQADAIVGPSQFMAQVLLKAGYTQARAILSATDPGMFQASPWEGPTKVVLYPVARSIQERKGYPHFVQMARTIRSQFPDVRFRMLNYAGDDLIEGTAYLSRPQMNAQLRAAYLAVVPGLWDEPFGTVVVEAMSAGRPVVLYDGGGSIESIEDGVSGVLVPRGDVAALTRAVIELLTDEQKASRIGRAARARVEAHFGYRRMAEQYLGVIKEVLAGKRGADVAPRLRPSSVQVP